MSSRMMESSFPDNSANLNALVVKEDDKVTQDVVNKNNVEIKNVVVNGYHRNPRERDRNGRRASRRASERVSALRWMSSGYCIC